MNISEFETAVKDKSIPDADIMGKLGELIGSESYGPNDNQIVAEILTEHREKLWYAITELVSL